VREAIQELESLFPPPKAEEGLSSQFQQIDRNNGYGANHFNNGGFGNMPAEDADDKKGKAKKKINGGKGASVPAGNVKDGKNGKNGVFEVPSTSSK
jgi:hypothetical protein